MAERVHAHGVDAYDLLAAVGRDCVGALQFLRGGVESGAAGAVDGRPADDKEIARLLGGRAPAPLGLGEDENLSDLDRWRSGKDRAKGLVSDGTALNRRG